MVRVIEGKIISNDLRGNKNYFKLAEGSSYRGFELLRVKLQKMLTEIQGKMILVRVSARFELLGVNCISHTINSDMYKQ